MKNKLTFFIGIAGAILFVLASILGGFLIDDYSITSQYISETYAIDTAYGMYLRVFGIIPSGILITVFCFLARKHFQSSKLSKIGFLGLGIFYGLATILVGIFPCDSGCNSEFIDPSLSQLIHNLTGFVTYIFVPISILLIGLGLRKTTNHAVLSLTAIICASVSILFVYVLFTNPSADFRGIYQRVIEGVFVFWIISCAFAIKLK